MKPSNQNINLYSYQSSSSNSGHHLAISDNGQSSLNSQPQSQIISTSKQSLSDVGIQCDNSSFRYPYSLDSAKDEELSKVQKVIPGKQNNVSNNQSIKSQQQMVDIKTSLRNKASQLKTLKPSYQNFLDYLNEPSIHQIILSNESSIHQPTFFQDSIIDQTLTNHLILFYQAQIGKLKVENNKLAAQIHSLKNDNSRYLQLQYEINQYNATKTNSYNSIRSENDSTNSIGKLDINNIVSKYEKIYTKYRSNKAKTRQFSEIAKKFRETSSKFGDH